ncbi:MAG: putative toxin-antitoxin system toxin component, PIN family [Saprospiraceae bacterium]
MKVVLDTNIIFTSISQRSDDYWIFEQFLDEAFVLCVNTEILAEYEEIIAKEMGGKAADNLMQLLAQAPNVEFVNTWFRWNLITTDPDDNKFVDCAIACNATCIVTEDKHFKVLGKIGFPKVEVLDVARFKEKLLP